MIKVINGKMWDGKKMYLPGDVITTLSEDEEDSLVEAGKAMYVEGDEKLPEGPSTKLIPEGNVESLKKYISTVDDVELLNKMIDEEKSELQRKTLIEAIEKRIETLEKVEDNEDQNGTKSDDNLNIDFNPEDVIANG